MNDYKMTPGERRATWGLGTVFSLRMLGMFMVLPVLTTYGMALQGASEALIGIAIGIYGLTQAVFQIPFGLLSDRMLASLQETAQENGMTTVSAYILNEQNKKLLKKESSKSTFRI